MSCVSRSCFVDRKTLEFIERDSKRPIEALIRRKLNDRLATKSKLERDGELIFRLNGGLKFNGIDRRVLWLEENTERSRSRAVMNHDVASNREDLAAHLEGEIIGNKGLNIFVARGKRQEINADLIHAEVLIDTIANAERDGWSEIRFSIKTNVVLCLLSRIDNRRLCVCFHRLPCDRRTQRASMRRKSTTIIAAVVAAVISLTQRRWTV